MPVQVSETSGSLMSLQNSSSTEVPPEGRSGAEHLSVRIVLARHFWLTGCAGLFVGMLCLTSGSAFATQENGAAAPDPVPQNRNEYERFQSRQVQKLKRLQTDLLTGKVISDFKRQEREYRAVLRTGTTVRNQQEMDILKVGLAYRIYSLSDSDIQGDPQLFPAYNTSLSRDLASAGPAAMMPNAQQRKVFRELVCSTAMPLLEQLVKEGNLLARTAALQRMLDLEVVPARSQGRMEMYSTVDDAYVNVLRSPEQPDAVKAVAASCMKIYLQKADAVPQIEITFAQAITEELERSFLSPAYQITLLQALEEVRAPRTFVGRKPPIAYCTLVKIIADRDADIEVRCRAARVLGRTGWDNQLNLDVLAWKTTDLVAEAAFLFNQSPDKKAPKWAYCGWYLYTAFHHETGEEAKGKGSGMPKGYLNRAPDSAVVRAAYTSSIAALAHLMSSNQPMPARAYGPAIKWSTDNRPADLTFDPACPPIPMASPAAGGAPAATQN